MLFFLFALSILLPEVCLSRQITRYVKVAKKNAKRKLMQCRGNSSLQAILKPFIDPRHLHSFITRTRNALAKRRTVHCCNIVKCYHEFFEKNKNFNFRIKS